MCPRALTALLFAAATTLVPAAAGAAEGNAQVAALQVGLRAQGLYGGAVDGLPGPKTALAVRVLQRGRGLPVDGVAGPQTRAALGSFGRRTLGRRVLRGGAVGWDVAALQFELARHGFPCAEFDGRLGRRTVAALRRFQRWAGLHVDGHAGPATLTALGRPPAGSPLVLSWPLTGPVTDGFGPRGARFHAGLDFPAEFGRPVKSAGAGRVVYARWHPGGYGLMATVEHGLGVKTRYAHLSRLDVRRGQVVAAGTQVGIVGSTGFSTGPHLHFELRVLGAAVDPLPALR